MDGRFDLLFEGPIGRMRPEDVLQFVSQAGGAVRVSFETEDRALGGPRGVDLEVDAGRLVALGPRGTGLRFGDLAVARGVLARAELEAVAAGDGPRLGERLVAGGFLEEAGVDDLLWERHARVVWALLAWERGSFVVSSAPEAASPSPERVVVDPPIPLSALLLDGLQRAESALGPSPT
ncbi:MAG: DUF4388 domain-containing protein [Candidatus Eisenbacteria bacterium]